MEKFNYLTRALLFSIVMCVFGGAIFGLIYYFGYFWAWLSVIEIILASAVFFKFINNPKWYHLLICVIWCTAWAFVFNFLSVFLCEVIRCALQNSISFKHSFIAVLESWKYDVDFEKYIIERLIQIGTLTGFGTLVGLIYTSAMYVTKKRNSNNNTNTNAEPIKNINTNNSVVIAEPVVVGAGADFFSANSTSEYLNVYNRVLKLCKDILVDFYDDNDQDLLDRKIERINERIMSLQSAATKQLINTYAKKELNKDLPKIDRKANEIILKLA